jgi:hypothetical protein
MHRSQARSWAASQVRDRLAPLHVPPRAAVRVRRRRRHLSVRRIDDEPRATVGRGQVLPERPADDGLQLVVGRPAERGSPSIAVELSSSPAVCPRAAADEFIRSSKGMPSSSLFEDARQIRDPTGPCRFQFSQPRGTEAAAGVATALRAASSAGDGPLTTTIAEQGKKSMTHCQVS